MDQPNACPHAFLKFAATVELPATSIMSWKGSGDTASIVMLHAFCFFVVGVPQALQL